MGYAKTLFFLLLSSVIYDLSLVQIHFFASRMGVLIVKTHKCAKTICLRNTPALQHSFQSTLLCLLLWGLAHLGGKIAVELNFERL